MLPYFENVQNDSQLFDNKPQNGVLQTVRRSQIKIFFALFPLLCGSASPTSCAGDALTAEPKPGWRESFDAPEISEKEKSEDSEESLLPEGWELRGKPGTPAAVFRVEKVGDSTVLRMKADKASASVLCNPENVDLKKFPVLSWRWKVNVLPENADGRKEEKDDQAIGIYVGTGSFFRKKSVSYRWDTLTPKDSAGKCSYGVGTIKIKWFTLRNENDGTGNWYVDSRNIAEDFKKAWGECPDEFYISISCNSQYTGTKAEAVIDWIKLVPAEGAPPRPRDEQK